MTSEIYCFDTSSLEDALEELYQTKDPHGSDEIEHATNEVQIIRNFLNSDIAKRHKLIVNMKREKAGG